MKVNFQEQYQLWDEQIRTGNGGLVYKKVLEFPSNYSFRRKDRFLFAKICRRVGLFKIATRILFPLIRTENTKYAATPEEIVEYAGSLIQLGCPNEGRHLLSQITSPQHPERFLFLAFSCFAIWDYENAIGHLKDYLQSPLLSAYQKNIGRVNLLASLVASNFLPEAEVLYKDLLLEVPAVQNKLLYLNICEIGLQLFIKTKNYQAGLDLLEKNKAAFQEVGGTYNFYQEKWNLILVFFYQSSLQNKTQGKIKTLGQETLQSLEKLSLKARANSYFEVLRDCEKWMAIISKDSHLLAKVFHGSPWVNYQKMILREAALTQAPISTHFCWPSEGQKPIEIDLNRKFTKPFQFILLLLSDLYSPLSYYQIFDTIYKGEFYHPTSSVPKIKQLVVKSRSLIKINCWPFKITRKNNLFSITPKKGHYFQLPLQTPQATLEWVQRDPQLHFFLRQWQKNLPTNERSLISAKQIARELKVSRRTLGSWLRRGLDLGIIEKVDHGKNTKYRLTPKS